MFKGQLVKQSVQRSLYISLWPSDTVTAFQSQGVVGIEKIQ